MNKPTARSKLMSPLWRRECERILRNLKRVWTVDDGPIQGLVIEDPPGFGAERLLDYLSLRLRRQTKQSPVLLASRHDTITDWPSLATEILAAAYAAECPHGMPREDLRARRQYFGATLFRDDVDERLRNAVRTNGRLNLLIPNLDALLERVEPQDHWAFRNVLQTLPLAVVATVSAGWRPPPDAAFYEFFRRSRPKGYEVDDVERLARNMRLSKRQTQMLATLSADLGCRPTLVEAAAAHLLLEQDATPEDVLRHVARTTATFLHSALANLAPQTRLILMEAARIGTPVTSGALVAATGLATGAVATQFSRLEEAGLIAPDRDHGRNRRYDFVDPVVGKLYGALVT